MNKKYFAFLFIFIFIMGPVSALGCALEGDKGLAKLNENKTVCLTCPTCDFINITSVDPSGDVFIVNKGMTANGATFCYEFEGAQLSELGTYQTDGYSQLDVPVGFCFESTLTGLPVSTGGYIIVSIFTFLGLLGVIWINIRFNVTEREKVWNRTVTEFFAFKSTRNKGNFAYGILYTFAYAMLRMIFVIYYLIILIFLFIFTELVQAFGINTFDTLMPQILNIALLGLIIIFVIFAAILFNIVMDLMRSVGEMMRGTYE